MSQSFDLGNTENVLFNGLDVDVLQLNGVNIWSKFSLNPLISLISRTIESVDSELTQEITSIGDWAFSSCKLLKTVKIPDSVTSLGNSAFMGCTSLTNIELPYSILEIKAQCFYGCSSLENITIPANVNSIWTSVFDLCENLTEITILNPTPPSLSDTSAISSATTTIYVPAESVSAYETANKWSELLTRQVNPVTFVGF